MICPDPSEVCCDATPNTAPAENKPPRCGSPSKAHIKSRITSGSPTSFGELPWNLIIQESGGDKKRNLYKCGASLIHPKVAITAAHCVTPYSEQPEKILVRAGEWDVDSRAEPLPFQDNFVEEILIYYDYNALSLKNDIAVLILAEHFQLADNVGIICLSSPDERIAENGCIASGWGKDAHPEGKYSPVLKKVQVPLVPRDYCLQALRATRLGPKYSLHKSFVCAGGKKNRDSCKGGGGSPLVCPLLEDRMRFVQVGIVSWGIGCGNVGVPGVYVNVPAVSRLDRGGNGPTGSSIRVILKFNYHEVRLFLSGFVNMAKCVYRTCR
jgi:kallikrein